MLVTHGLVERFDGVVQALTRHRAADLFKSPLRALNLTVGVIKVALCLLRASSNSPTSTGGQTYRRCANTSSSCDSGHLCFAAAAANRRLDSYGSVVEGAVPGLAPVPLHRAAL
jgi:hypothetical protein